MPLGEGSKEGGPHDARLAFLEHRPALLLASTTPRRLEQFLVCGAPGQDTGSWPNMGLCSWTVLRPVLRHVGL